MHSFGKQTQYFILNELSLFNCILGYKFLNEIEGVIDTSKSLLTKSQRYYKTIQRRNINISINLFNNIKNKLKKIILRQREGFPEENVKVPCNTRIKATIDLTVCETIWSKSYAYSPAIKYFVNDFLSMREENIMKNSIVEPSRSLYDYPV